MLVKKWANLERQRPRLRMVKWGMTAGAAVTIVGILGAGSPVLGLLILLGFGAWGFSILKK